MAELLLKRDDGSTVLVQDAMDEVLNHLRELGASQQLLVDAIFDEFEALEDEPEGSDEDIEEDEEDPEENEEDEEEEDEDGTANGSD